MVNKHAWFLTINNPTEVDLELCHSATRASSIEHRQLKMVDGTYVNTLKPHEYYSPIDNTIKGLAYFGFSTEVGKSGTPHLHCVVIFKFAKSFATIKKLFPRANIQPVRGTFQEAISYIRKDGRFHSIAFVPKQRYVQYVINDNKLAKLALEGDLSISKLEDRITSLEDKLDKLIVLISQKKILNTLTSDEDIV